MKVSLVIPGRNAERTIRFCLDSVIPLLESGDLQEIVFVDDGSTDGTAAVAQAYPMKVVKSSSLGPGGARNLGWRQLSTDLVWFIDSDCVAQSDALARLVVHMKSDQVGGVGGSYANLETGSLLAWLIHDEIRQRHLDARSPIDFLGGFNVLYRREVLEATGGFDELLFNGPGSPGAEDADLSYRAAEEGWTLLLEPRSIVGHYHPTRLLPYLRTQARHGAWVRNLYREHPGRAGRNSYTGPADALQVPWTALALASLPLLVLPSLRWIPGMLMLGLVLLQVPMTLAILRRTRRWRGLLYVPVGCIRAVARLLGLVRGV